MAKRLRVAVIGCGAIAEHLHIPDYKSCPEAELVALCDVDRAQAKKVADKYAPNAKIFTDHKKMLKEMDLDAVTITLPNRFHCPVSVDALNAGCHVLVEKPMAQSIAETKRMVAAAKKAKKLLMVNQTQRLFPAHAKAKEIMDSGIMGKVLHVNAIFGHAGPESWSPRGKWFFKKKDARFGAMADLGVHKVDLIRYLTGKEITEISAHMGTLEKKGDVEDNFVSSFKFKDGTLGTVSASWTVKGVDANHTILYCANGTLRVCEIPGRPLVANLVNPACEIDFDLPEAASNEDESWGLDVSGKFIRACLGKEKPFCTGEEGMKSLAVIMAAEKSALTGRNTKVTL